MLLFRRFKQRLIHQHCFNQCRQGTRQENYETFLTQTSPGRPIIRAIKLNATPEEITQAIFKAGRKQAEPKA